MPAVHCLIRGLVQGVAFRYFTRDTARRLGLTGWVRNLPDGAVEAYIQGQDHLLEQCLHDLRQGPPAARVDEVVVAEAEDRADMAEFVILR